MPGKMARSDPRPIVRVTRGAGSGQHLASVLQEGRENANIDAGLGFIWRISVYAIPPHTPVISLDFEDHPFERYRHDATCALCGSIESFLDEVVIDDDGGRMFVCSDTDYCERRRAAAQDNVQGSEASVASGTAGPPHA
jgi:phosphonate metabolism protein PhnJ